VLAGRIRETDLAGWLKRRTIGIILPETPTKGAWKLADDICQLLTGGLRLPNCEVYEYPPDSDDEDGGNGGGPPSRKARSLHELIDDPLPTWKRAVDMVGAGTALAIAAPIMLLVMLLIKIQSPGPALYRQERIGRHRRRFKVWKFRTMVCDADRILQECLAKSPELREEWNREHKLKNDPRITPIGHWLRKTSVDELPQLWNVLCGQMSLVGPRPIVAAEIVKYADKFGPYCKVLPGITGLWQVSGRNDTSYAERVDLDCHYARHSSLRLDVAILFKTVHVVLLRRGAY
jgi:Undecaprenyl-phosphate galactose phosphotransferase WbaP